MKIPVSKIIDSSQRVREVERDDSFRELVESIRQHGLLQPVKARPHDGQYELIYGHRRVAAIRELGWPECEAIVEQVSDEEALLQALLENIHRKDLTVFEEAEIYATLQKRGYSLAQIADMAKKSQAHVSTRINLIRLPVEVQQMVKRGSSQHIPTTEAGAISVDSASRIAGVSQTPDEAVAMARKAVDERLTRDEIRDLTSRLKEADKPEQRRQILERPFSGYVITSRTETERPASLPPLPRPEPFHTAAVPVADQFHAKLVWNLNRIDLTRYAHFTIGYSQRSWEQVRELLRLAEVTAVADARRNPVSQHKPEFSKTNLEMALERINIQYWPLPELGIEAEEREGLAATHDYERLFSEYDQQVTWSVLSELLGEALDIERIAFLCVELDPNLCHRHRIAMLLEEEGYLTLDL